MPDIFCWKCGTPNDDQRQACGKCGTLLKQQAQQSVPYVPPPPQSAPRPVAGPQKGLPNQVGLCVLGFLFPLIGIIIGLIYIGDAADPAKQKTGKEVLWWSLVLPAILILFCVVVPLVGHLLASYVMTPIHH